MPISKSIFTVPENLGQGASQQPVIADSPHRQITPEYFQPPTLSSPKPQGLWTESAQSSATNSPQRQTPRPPFTFATPPPPVAGVKRPPSRNEHSHSNSEPLAKRRHFIALPRHTLEAFDFPPPPPVQHDPSPLQPSSPLFFSHSARRPRLPPRFSSGEAGARMLSKAHAEESNNIRTVTLARGSFAGSSPPAVPHSAARPSLERANLTRTSSPELTDHPRLLASVGVVELLEQDFRPTFIIDLGDSSNYGAGFLRIVFANAALRSNSTLLEAVQGRPLESSPRSDPRMEIRSEPPLKGFIQFKAWLLSASQNGESLDVCLPSYIHAGMSWSCSTLRKRLRVASASGTIARSSAASPAISHPTPSTTLRSPKHIRSPLRSSHNEEPQDYFGDAAPPASADLGNRMSTIIHSIEPPNENALPIELFNGTMSRDTFATRDLSSDPSFVNECVLSAAAASNFDDFSSAPKEVGFFDWTRLPISENLPRHIQFARSIDWASTALGPIEYWPPDLRQMCNLIMASPHPAAMYWGDDLVAIYNEAYVLLAGQKHPNLMGQSYKDAWAEIWDEVKDVFADARLTGQATMKDDDCLFIKRSHYLEETYFSWSIIPMVGTDGSVTGLYNPAFEKTRRKIAERRMLTLREVGERTATARDVRGFWVEVAEALEFNEFDTPFVLLYSVCDEFESDAASIHSSSLLGGKQCTLEGTLGVPSGHPCAPETIDLKTGMEGFAPFFRDCMKTDKPVLLHVFDDTPGPGEGLPLSPGASQMDGGLRLQSSLLEGLEWRGFQDPCRSVVVCPVHPTTGENILGFLVLGVNPRRPYDDDYSLFVQLLSRQLATSLASVVLFEEEIRRGQKAAKLAALDRIELSEQLAARTQEARDIETRFTRMAELSPTGLFIADSQGHITYCNDTWYEITRVPKNALSTDRWMDAVLEEDQPRIRALWHECIVQCVPVSGEFRFKAPWEDRNGHKSDTWVLFAAYPEKYADSDPFHPDDKLKSVFGSITNISPQKWAEGFQKRKMEEAIELKRQQENFIDITSHEMRNPLSAILQCADEISTVLSEARESGQQIDTELISNSIDAAQTITLCAQHQKRIVDDVLTLSKLDSHMLMVTPVDAQPLSIVQRSLKMFESEINSADIKMQFIVDDSFKKLGVDWVKIDPQRVLQVLINLTTNAIKFTTSENKRTIIVSVAASLEKPSASPNRVVDFFPSRRKAIDMYGQDWGDGEDVYVQFAVQDTGRGLSPDEKKLLFMRFSQASPRTHITYGGSGLGLFISRELTELQGGEIGVASESGKGSTFAFYVRAKRSSPPQSGQEQFPALVQKQPAADAKSRRNDPIRTKDFAAGADGKGQANSNTSAAAAAAPPRSKADIKVLIVEDNLVNQRVLQKQLKHLGFTVSVANHGGEALDRLRESTFWHENQLPTLAASQTPEISVVLMDQEMPVMDGLKATRTIREWERSGELIRHVPIIAVTANARSEQIETLLGVGMDDVQSKPFRIPELVPKIEELAAKYAPKQSKASQVPLALAEKKKA